MKKISAFFLAVLLIFSSACSEVVTWQDVADSLDEDTLMAVTAFFVSRIIERKGGGFDLDAGVYVVGSDLPGGAWSVENISGSSSELIVYASADVYGSELPFPFFDQFMSPFNGVDRVGRIFLSEGNIVEIKGRVHFAPYAGVIEF